MIYPSFLTRELRSSGEKRSGFVARGGTGRTLFDPARSLDVSVRLVSAENAEKLLSAGRCFSESFSFRKWPVELRQATVYEAVFCT